MVRKRLVCKCGCNGWCTFFPLLVFLHWAFGAMATGVLPLMGPLLEAWSGARAVVARTAMRLKYCLLYLKRDWPEFCERFGYPTWASNLRPCLCCSGFGDGLFDVTGVGPTQLPWWENTDAEYDEACSRCEHLVVLSPAQHETVKGHLVFDKRTSGARAAHGRALKQDIAELGLLSGDRLEPTTWLRDVGDDFNNISVFPYPVVFWRPSDATLCTHRWRVRLQFFLGHDCLHFPCRWALECPEPPCMIMYGGQPPYKHVVSGTRQPADTQIANNSVSKKMPRAHDAPHRCPLMDPALGITPNRSICFDLLHTHSTWVPCSLGLGR